MAKFSKGDKVESVKTGAKGVVDEVYGDEKYAVLFDGATNPDRVEGFQIKAANAKACNGKFKVGDKVRHVDDGQDGPVGVVKGVYGDGKIKVKFPGLMKDGFDGFEEEELVMANGCARNAVAKDIDGNLLKVGDRVMYERSRGTWETDVIKRIDEDGTVYLSKSMLFGRDASTGLVKNGSSASLPLASVNAVVQNAIKARRARNAEEFDKGFVESKARSIYNDLDDLLDYIKRFSKSGIPTYMLASVQDAMKAIDRI